jgi:hypothetical protein
VLWTLEALWTVRSLWTLWGVKNLDDQDLLGIENLGIPRAIGLQFRGCWETICLEETKAKTHAEFINHSSELRLKLESAMIKIPIVQSHLLVFRDFALTQSPHINIL